MKILGRDEVGRIAETENGWLFYITDCCDAAVTGAAAGVVCKGCFREVNPALGGVPQDPRPKINDPGLTGDYSVADVNVVAEVLTEISIADLPEEDIPLELINALRERGYEIVEVKR